MCNGSKIIKQRQLAIRREMDRRGILLKVVSADSGIPYATLASYFPADANADPVQIAGGAIYSLADGKALPADLLSMLMPQGWQIMPVSECLDLDELAALAEDLFQTKMASHRADSPAGTDICPEREKPQLDAKAARLKAVGR